MIFDDMIHIMNGFMQYQTEDLLGIRIWIHMNGMSLDSYEWDLMGLGIMIIFFGQWESSKPGHCVYRDSISISNVTMQ